MRVELKQVGKSGQVSVGKRYAGKILRLEHRADGTIVLMPAAVVPESQLWTLQEPHRSRIARALEWAAKHPPRKSSMRVLLAKAGKRGRPK
ncbi:MAG: hypothetical protein HZA23_06715 [Nitrospirae bacterium]|nr:hypothetical protein [Nitrospirota bacterium]